MEISIGMTPSLPPKSWKISLKEHENTVCTSTSQLFALPLGPQLASKNFTQQFVTCHLFYFTNLYGCPNHTPVLGCLILLWPPPCLPRQILSASLLPPPLCQPRSSPRKYIFSQLKCPSPCLWRFSIIQVTPKVLFQNVQLLVVHLCQTTKLLDFSSLCLTHE